jgi:Na+-driven multidrug efflux pump
MLCQLSNSFYIATSQSKNIIYGSASQAISNVLFDYLFIFGIGIFPEMGLHGAALASVLSDVVFFIVAYALFFRTQDAGSIKNIFSNRVDFGLQKEIFYKASPLMVQYLLSIGAWEVFFIYVEHLGKSESAVSQILRSVFGIVGVATWALASTCNSMVSNLIGQHQQEQVISMIQKIVRVSFCFAFIVGLPLLLFPKYFLGLMTGDSHLVDVGYRSLQIVVLATWMLSISTIYFNGVVGTGNTRINMFFELAAIILYLIYCSYIIEYRRMPLAFAWGSEFVYWLSLFAMSTFYLHRIFHRNLKLNAG